MFGFKDISYKQYETNFLKTVVFQISFNKIEGFINKKSYIIDNFKSIFPRINTPNGGEIAISFDKEETPIVQHIKNDGTIEMKSESGQKVLNISNNSLSLTISGLEYKNYLELKGLIENINDFFQCCSIKETFRIAIRKINIVEFNYTDDDNTTEILGTVINENLVGNVNYLPKSKFTKQNMHLLNFNNGDYNLNLKYGLNIQQIPSSNIAQVIIDIDLFNSSINPVSELINITDNINKEIFNAFNWSISETFLNLLNDRIRNT